MKHGMSFVILLAFICLSSPTPADAVNLRNVVRNTALTAAGGALVQASAGPINDFINTATLNRGAKFQGHTKVVPIVSIGNGSRIGAAQVGGTSRTAVNSTEAVAQLEASFTGIRIKIMIPIDSVNPLRQFRRVQGVGVTAIIDARL